MLTAIVPIILYFPSTYLFLLAYNYSTPKILLIPKDYAGALRIVFEEECGMNYDMVDGIRTLEFAENGILILKEDFDGHINYKCFVVDKLGNKKEVPQKFDFDSDGRNPPYVLVGGSGTIGQPIEANSTIKEQKGIIFSDFYVFNKDTKESYDFMYQQKFDSLTIEIVNLCRQMK